ncbi:MAG: hypothetical protein ACJ74L_05050 [Gaiellaceae bacterium]
MWPEPVERIAQFLRESGATGRIEQLPAGIDTPPGAGVRADAFDCDGRTVVVLVPDDRAVDLERIARRGGCPQVQTLPARDFPYRGARVLADRSLLVSRTVWLQAGSPRYFLGVGPSQLFRLTRAELGTFVAHD